jgi:hypothetical protein
VRTQTLRDVIVDFLGMDLDTEVVVMENAYILGAVAPRLVIPGSNEGSLEPSQMITEPDYNPAVPDEPPPVEFEMYDGGKPTAPRINDSQRLPGIQ